MRQPRAEGELPVKRRRRPLTPPTTCSFTGKVGYGRRWVARAVAHALEARDEEPMSAYLCVSCGRWHVGHDRGIRGRGGHRP